MSAKSGIHADPEIVHRGPIERKAESLPRYAVVPAKLVSAWGLEGTTVVEVELNGQAMGRRSLKPWGRGRWFLDLPEKLCRRAGVDTGDEIVLRLRRADECLPGEIASLIANDPRAKRNWEALTGSRRRMLREHVLEAKRPATRERRVRKALLGERGQ